jgi:cytochrome P450
MHVSRPDVESHAVEDLLTTGGAIGTPEGVLVTSYAGCHAAFRDRALIPGVREMSKRMGLDAGPVGGAAERFLLWTDGAEHADLRRIVAPWFTPARVERLRHDVESLVESLLDRFEASNAQDFMAPVANRIPGAVFCWMVGAPVAWSDNLFDLSERILKVFTGDDAFTASITDAASELASLVFELIDTKQHEPGDDLMSTMLASIDNDAFTLTDAASMAFELLAASTDNTAHSIGAAVHQLATHPDQFALLCDGPQLSGSAVEECGRREPRVRADTRHAISATTLCGVDVPEGSLITLSILDANHDPAAFPNPERFDITRDPQQPHLGFGLGRHHCLGASLARMEIGVVLRQLATRWTALAPAGDAVIERSNNTIVRYLPISAY